MRGLRSLATTVFVPSAVLGMGQGAGAPIIALVARDLGASVGVAGVMVGLVGLGSVFGVGALFDMLCASPQGT